MDPTYAKHIGVNIDDLLVSQPDTGEQGLEIAELLIRSGALDVVAVDSVAALTPKAEIEGEMGDTHVGLQARLMSQALRKLAGTLNRTDTICLFTNQLREKIGVMFGNPETTPGGRALKFYSSVRLDIRRIETLKEGVEAIGNRVRVKVVKNKVAPPFKQAEFDIIYGSGISWEGTVLDAGLERKVVTKSGSYFSFGDERLGQGRQNATAFLREHPDVCQAILAGIQVADRARAGRLGAAPARRLQTPSPSRTARSSETATRSRKPPRRSSADRHRAARGPARPRGRRARRRSVAHASGRRRRPRGSLLTGGTSTGRRFAQLRRGASARRGAGRRRPRAARHATSRRASSRPRLEQRAVSPSAAEESLAALERRRARRRRAARADSGRIARRAGLRRRGDPARPRRTRRGRRPRRGGRRRPSSPRRERARPHRRPAGHRAAHSALPGRQGLRRGGAGSRLPAAILDTDP